MTKLITIPITNIMVRKSMIELKKLKMLVLCRFTNDLEAKAISLKAVLEKMKTKRLKLSSIKQHIWTGIASLTLQELMIMLSLINPRLKGKLKKDMPNMTRPSKRSKTTSDLCCYRLLNRTLLEYVKRKNNAVPLETCKTRETSIDKGSWAIAFTPQLSCLKFCQEWTKKTSEIENYRVTDFISKVWIRIRKGTT